jgi:hypothetical protein
MVDADAMGRGRVNGVKSGDKVILDNSDFLAA